MKIICRRFKSEKGETGYHRRPKFVNKKMAVAAALVIATLMLHFAGEGFTGWQSSVFAVSDSDCDSEADAAEEQLTVDDSLSDVYLGSEEIDTGVSATYEGELDVPDNVRLDKIDFGTDFCKPLDTATVTSLFDYRVNPVTGRYVFHTGIDLGAPSGANIYAMKAGTVVSAAYDSGYGNFVIIEHSDGIRTLYAHCSKLLVSAGDSVEMGEVIALVGSTGNSTGPHLHLEFRIGNVRYDPEWVIGGIYS